VVAGAEVEGAPVEVPSLPQAAALIANAIAAAMEAMRVVVTIAGRGAEPAPCDTGRLASMGAAPFVVVYVVSVVRGSVTPLLPRRHWPP
jgi:hypothetical protein